MNTTSEHLSWIRSYRIFYSLVCISLFIGWLFFGSQIKDREIPLYVLLSITAVAPIFAKVLLNQEKPIYLLYHVGILLVFTLVFAASNSVFGFALIGIWFVSLLASVLLGFALPPKDSLEPSRLLKVRKTDNQDMDPHWEPPLPPVLSPIAIIQQRIHEAEREIQHYAEKLVPLREIRSKSEQYLQEVDQRLNYPHLSRSNRTTSLKIQEMLQRSLDNYGLMIRFFEEARLRYQREKRNLEERLGNLEIIQFLQDKDRLEEITSIEKAALDIEFQEQLRKLESELPAIEAEMDAKTQLLSHDLKEELSQTIERLQQS